MDFVLNYFSKLFLIVLIIKFEVYYKSYNQFTLLYHRRILLYMKHYLSLILISELYLFILIPSSSLDFIFAYICIELVV